MIIGDAKKIAKLLEYREELKSELRLLDQCESIDGHINDGVNGLPFKWKRSGKEIKALIEGIKEELAKIDETFSKFKFEVLD